MSEGRFSLRASAYRRHVPAHAPHRVRCLVLALALLIAPALFAESQGTIAEITQDAELFKQARDPGPSHGVLPKGTLLRLTGEIDGRFYPVEVELEQGNIEGWVRQDFLNLEEQRREQEERKSRKKDGAAVASANKSSSANPEAGRASEAVRPRRPRLRVPKDESLLLVRQPTFFFGLHGGGSWSITNADNGSSFTGIGFSLGGHVGGFLAKEVPVRVEIGYTGVGGTDASGNVGNFGFVDGGLAVGYVYDDFEFFGKLHYAYAASVSNLPTALANSFSAVSSLSSFWIGAGAGYKVMKSDVTTIMVRGMYNLSFLASPFFFQTFQLQLVFDLHG